MSSIEHWRPIPGFPGYDVSDLGRVRSYRARGGKGTASAWHISSTPQRILRPGKGKYPFVHIVDELGHHKTRRIHSLVMLAFVGPCPENMEVCHNDDNPFNNELTNLRYDTHRRNAIEAVINGCRKFDEQDILSMRYKASNGATTAELSVEFDITPEFVGDICRHDYYTVFGGPVTQWSKTKLSDDDLSDIHKRANNGELGRLLAQEYGIHECTVSRIKHDKYARAVPNI